MSRFAACLPYVLAHEGGLVDDAQDPGGWTNLGITQATLSAFLGRPATVAELKALTPATAAPIYLANYWNPCRCDDLPPGVDYAVFDPACNSGPGHAARFLQEAVGVQADGSIGPQTLAAVNRIAPKLIISAIRAKREAFYRSLPTFDHFGKGWLTRLAEVTSQALAWTA